MQIKDGAAKPTGRIAACIKERVSKNFENLQTKEREKIQEIILEQRILRETAGSYANRLSALTELLQYWKEYELKVELVVSIIYRLRNCDISKESEIQMCKNFDEQAPSELKADKKDFLRGFFSILKEADFPDCFFEKETEGEDKGSFIWLALITLYCEFIKLLISEGSSVKVDFVVKDNKMRKALESFFERVISEKYFETQKNYELVSNVLKEVYLMLNALLLEKQMTDLEVSYIIKWLNPFKVLLTKVLGFRQLKSTVSESIQKYKCSSLASTFSLVLKILQLRSVNEKLWLSEKDAIQEILEDFLNFEVVLMTPTLTNKVNRSKFQLKAVLLNLIASHLKIISLTTSDDAVLRVLFELVKLSKLSFDSIVGLKSRIMRIITDPSFIFFAFIRCFFDDLEMVNRLITEDALGFEMFFELTKLLRKQAGGEIEDPKRSKVALLLARLRPLIEKSSKVLQFNVKPLLANLP